MGKLEEAGETPGSRKQGILEAKTGCRSGRVLADLGRSDSTFPNISWRWLMVAGGLVFFGAGLLTWLTLCLLFWQGSWQLLYHPAAAIIKTPESAGLSYESVRFATTETGVPRLSGWWIPADDSRRVVLYLHGASGNLSDTVDSIAVLHGLELSVFAFDYRGYGASPKDPDQPRPSEKQWRRDAEWALTYLTLTRHIAAKNIVIFGTSLGANLAAELAADHGELAAVILEEPEVDPLDVIFKDGRSKLVPAHALISDRFFLESATSRLKIPSLWLIPRETDGSTGPSPLSAYQKVAVSKSMVFLRRPLERDSNFAAELAQWLGDI